MDTQQEASKVDRTSSRLRSLWGEDNTFADALSRKHLEDDEPSREQEIACVAALTELSTVLSDSLCSKIIQGYDNDVFCKAFRKALPLRSNCKEVDGLLFLEDRLIIPADFVI